MCQSHTHDDDDDDNRPTASSLTLDRRPPHTHTHSRAAEGGPGGREETAPFEGINWKRGRQLPIDRVAPEQEKMAEATAQQQQRPAPVASGTISPLPPGSSAASVSTTATATTTATNPGYLNKGAWGRGRVMDCVIVTDRWHMLPHTYIPHGHSTQGWRCGSSGGGNG